MEGRRWPIWQIAVLILAIGGAAVYVASGMLEAGPHVSTTPVAQASPVVTAYWPVIQTKTPTPTATRTPTPGPTDTPTATPTLTPTPTNTPIVVDPKIRALGRLETAQYVMQVIIDLEREPSSLWQQAFGTDKLLLIAEGQVVMGFDLTKIRADDILVSGESVKLILSPPEILYHGVDEDKTYVYERKTGFLVAPDDTLETEARRLAQQAVVDWAVEHQAFEKAEEFGVLYLESFLRSLGFADIEIEVRDVR